MGIPDGYDWDLLTGTFVIRGEGTLFGYSPGTGRSGYQFNLFFPSIFEDCYY
jgi:hypothetical protein